MGIGGAEAGILLIIVFVLFGPTLLAFWLGYTLGQKRKQAGPAEPTPPAAPPAGPHTARPATDDDAVTSPSEKDSE